MGCHSHSTAVLYQQGLPFSPGIHQLLEKAIRERAFPAASVAVLYRGELVALRGFGRHTYDPAAPPVTAETIFDIASVSKVTATTTAAAILFERGQLDLDSNVPGRDDLTIRGLLTHTSGLPAYLKLFERTSDRENLLEACLRHAAGGRAQYPHRVQ